MTTIVLPNINRWSNATWTFMTGDSVMETLGDEEIIIKSTKKRFMMSLSLKGLTPEEERLWGTALMQLCSLENTFEAIPPEFVAPHSGYAGPNPLVAGSSQIGFAVNADGATPSTLIVKQGDYFPLAGRLRRATQDASSNGLGQVTLNFFPSLQKSPADNEEIKIDNPVGTFRLEQPISTTHLREVLAGNRQIAAIEVTAP